MDVLLFGKTEHMRNGLINKTIYSLFEEMARRVPHYTAITCKDETMSYAELSNKVNSLAAGLRIEKVRARHRGPYDGKID